MGDTIQPNVALWAGTLWSSWLHVLRLAVLLTSVLSFLPLGGIFTIFYLSLDVKRRHPQSSGLGLATGRGTLGTVIAFLGVLFMHVTAGQ